MTSGTSADQATYGQPDVYNEADHRNAERCAEFYRDVFELVPTNKESELPGYHLTDGRVTLSILPWSIDVFAGMSIKRPGPDHIGFKVENLDTFKDHIKMVSGLNPYIAPVPLGGKESEVRKRLLAQHGPFDDRSSGTWIDITTNRSDEITAETGRKEARHSTALVRPTIIRHRRRVEGRYIERGRGRRLLLHGASQLIGRHLLRNLTPLRGRFTPSPSIYQTSA
jgi:hypothetical protein